MLLCFFLGVSVWNDSELLVQCRRKQMGLDQYLVELCGEVTLIGWLNNTPRVSPDWVTGFRPSTQNPLSDWRWTTGIHFLVLACRCAWTNTNTGYCPLTLSFTEELSSASSRLNTMLFTNVWTDVLHERRVQLPTINLSELPWPGRLRALTQDVSSLVGSLSFTEL